MHIQRVKPYNDTDLDRLTPTERAVLQAYYDSDRTWEQIADVMHYSTSRIYQIRFNAIKKIQQEIPQNL